MYRRAVKKAETLRDELLELFRKKLLEDIEQNLPEMMSATDERTGYLAFCAGELRQLLELHKQASALFNTLDDMAAVEERHPEAHKQDANHFRDLINATTITEKEYADLNIEGVGNITPKDAAELDRPRTVDFPIPPRGYDS